MLPLQAVAGSSRGGMSPGAPGVEEEPGAAATDRVVVKEEALADEEAEVKTEPPCEDGAGGANETACDLDVKDELELGPVRVQARVVHIFPVVVKEEALADEEAEVKTEPPCEDGAGGASETAAPAGPDCDLDVKGELELGPVRVQARNIHVSPGTEGIGRGGMSSGAASVKEPGAAATDRASERALSVADARSRDHVTRVTRCCVRLSRIPAPEAPLGRDARPAPSARTPPRPGGRTNTSLQDNAGTHLYEYDTDRKIFKPKEHNTGKDDTLDNLSRRNGVHNNKKSYSCKMCKEQFMRKEHLKIHIRLHTGGIIYSCEVCEKKFVHVASFKKHKRIHTGEKPFSCGICGKRFNIKGNCKTHMRYHEGNKPYTCRICQKKFSQLTHLKKHNRTHTREKPFSCEICDQHYAHEDTLKKHRGTHTKQKPFIYYLSFS